MNGSNSNTATYNPNPSFGTKNVPNPSNTPGSRSGCAFWVDNNGGLWLFGGIGYISYTLGILRV
jgi:hypothetical protein